MVELALLKVLVVEDEGPAALMIEDMLLDLGCRIVASAAELDRACELAATADIDLALLDLNLAGSSAMSVAYILEQRGVPLFFAPDMESAEFRRNSLRVQAWRSRFDSGIYRRGWSGH